MRKGALKTLSIPAVLLLLATVLAPRLSADESEEPISNPQGFFVTGSLQGIFFSGELDGRLILGNNRNVFYIPKLKPGGGISIGFGYKKPNGLWSFSYQRSFHGTHISGDDTRSTYQAFTGSGQAFFFPNGRNQPYLLLGIQIPWIQVKNGAKYWDKTMTANYIGIVLNVGAGLLHHINRRLFISGGITFGLTGILWAKAQGIGRDLQDLYQDQWGQRWDHVLHALGTSIVFSVGWML